MKLEAIIFDLDGVLLPTNVLHRAATVAAIKTITGIDTTDHPYISEYSVMSTKLKIKKIQELYKFDESLNSVILQLKDKIFFELISIITPNSNVVECLVNIRSRGIKTAIASNSRLSNLYHVLELTNLRKYFDTIVSAEEVPNRKPAPDILFEVYKRLGVDGTNTIFVEDTDEGATAGHQSLSTVVMVNNPTDLHIELFGDWL